MLITNNFSFNLNKFAFLGGKKIYIAIIYGNINLAINKKFFFFFIYFPFLP